MSKKPTLHLLFNHTLDDVQKHDAHASLGVERIVYLPDTMLDIWGNISPKRKNLKDLLYPIYDYMHSQCKRGDFILVQGDAGATFLIVQKAMTLGVKPIYATTERIAKETMKNGTLVKTSVFKHVIFRHYGA